MKHASVEEELSIVMLCKSMGWTYEDYMNTPQWFIEVLQGMFQADAQKANREMKKKYGTRKT